MSVLVRATVTPLGLSSGDVPPFQFNGWNGRISNMQNQGDPFQRLGQAGAGIQITGTRGRTCQISGWMGFTDQTTALVQATAWEAIECLTVKIDDGFGRSLPRVRLTNCQVKVTRAKGPTNGTAQILYRVDCTADAEKMPDS